MAGFLDWAFRNRITGGITVGQAPNPPIWIAAAAAFAEWLSPPHGQLATVSGWAWRLALVWWAADELLRGVNPWRRFLGAATLGYLAYRFVASWPRA